MAKFLCHATVHTNFLEKKTLKEKYIYITTEETFLMLVLVGGYWCQC